MYSLSILTRNGPVVGQPVGVPEIGTVVWLALIPPAPRVAVAAVSVL